MYVLLKYSSHPLRLLFESSVCFVQHVWRCGYCSRVATNREQYLIERILYNYVEQYLIERILYNYVGMIVE